MMNDFMKLAVDENQLMQNQDEQLIEQLYEENQQLRAMLQIHQQSQSKEAIERDMNDEERQGEGDDVEDEIHSKLLTYE